MFFSSVRDVLFQNFETYKPDVQELICVADHLGSMMQYETPGFLPNKRIHRGIVKMLCKFEWEKKNQGGDNLMLYLCYLQVSFMLCSSEIR